MFGDLINSFCIEKLIDTCNVQNWFWKYFSQMSSLIIRNILLFMLPLQNTSWLLLGFIFISIRMEEKWIISAKSKLELPNSDIPALTTFKDGYAAVLRMPYFFNLQNAPSQRLYFKYISILSLLTRRNVQMMSILYYSSSEQIMTRPATTAVLNCLISDICF